jgi:hypothetical protein
MKRIINLYQQNSLLAMIINSIAFFLWAITLIVVVTIMAVAFTG